MSAKKAIYQNEQFLILLPRFHLYLIICICKSFQTVNNYGKIYGNASKSKIEKH